MEVKTKFKTNTGFCHVLSDCIILTPFKFIEYSTVKLKKNKRNLFLALYIFFIVLLSYFTFHRYLREEWLQVFVIGGFTTILFSKTFELIKIVTAKIITKNDIKAVNFFPAVNTNSITWYKIHFEKNGKLKSKFFTLPKSAVNSSLETENSARIMINNGFLKNNKRTTTLFDYFGLMLPNDTKITKGHKLGSCCGPSFFAKFNENEVLVWCFEKGLVIGTNVNLDGILESIIVEWDEVRVTHYSKSRDDRYDRVHGSVSSLWSWSLSIELHDNDKLNIVESVSTGRLIRRDYIHYWSQMARLLKSRGENFILDKITQIDTIFKYVSDAQSKIYLEQINENKVINFGALSVMKDGFIINNGKKIPWSQLKAIEVSLDYVNRNKLSKKLNPLPDHEKKRFYLNIILLQNNNTTTHNLLAESIPNWGGFCKLCEILQDNALNK